MFTESSSKLSTWNAGNNGIPFAQKSSFRCEVLVPRMRLRRDVLFTFEDLVVSFGGATTFFLGMSVMDVAKLTFYMAEYVVRGLWRVLARALMSLGKGPKQQQQQLKRKPLNVKFY